MHLTVIDHRQQPSPNQTKKHLLTLATLLLNDIYYPVIDIALSEVYHRFGLATTNIMCGIGALTPGSGQFLEYRELRNKVRRAVQVKCRRFSARVETDEAYDRAQNS